MNLKLANINEVQAPYDTSRESLMSFLKVRRVKVFRHPKYYEELRKIRKQFLKEQADKRASEQADKQGSEQASSDQASDEDSSNKR
jgi:hypothetical protein